MIKTLITIVTIISICLLTVLLNITTPLTAGPFGILIIFISAYIALVGLFAYLLHTISLMVARVSSSLSPRKPILELTFRRSYYYSTIVASGPIMLIGLMSVGSVGVYEILLVIIFIIIGCLYVSKRIK